MAEFHRGRITAMLAADADVQLRIDRTSQLDGKIHQLADAVLVQAGERIALEDLGVIVRGKELARVVAAEAEGHLCEVVGAEAEEISIFGDFIRGQGGTRDFNHRADFILDLHIAGGDFSIGCFHNNLLDELQFLFLADQRNHDFGTNRPVGMRFLRVDGSADNGPGLHLCDFRISNSQAAAAVAHHGIEFMQGSDDVLDGFHALALGLGQQRNFLLRGGNELMQRRIQEPDADRAAFQRFIELFKVALLIRQDFIQRSFAFFHCVGADHLAESGDAVAVKEHVLGAGQTDALRAQLDCLAGVLRRVGVGADFRNNSIIVHNL